MVLEFNVGDERLVFFNAAVEEGKRLLARGDDIGCEATFGKGFLDNRLDHVLVFDDEDHRQLIHVVFYPLRVDGEWRQPLTTVISSKVYIGST